MLNHIFDICYLLGASIPHTFMCPPCITIGRINLAQGLFIALAQTSQFEMLISLMCVILEMLLSYTFCKILSIFSIILIINQFIIYF